jgi:hypothetical protein
MTQRPEFSAKSDASVKTSFFWEVHKYMNEYIRFADAKAGFVAAGSTALIGALVSSAIFDAFFKVSFSGLRMAALIGLLLLLGALVFAVLTIRPRLHGKSLSGGYIFWESVAAHGSASTFRQAASKLDSEDQSAELLNHLFVLAQIAERKYARVNLSIWMGLCGGIVTAMVLFLGHALR